MNGVQYKLDFLMKGSEAYRLWEEAKKDPKLYKKLDQHLKDLDKKNEELMKRYS